MIRRKKQAAEPMSTYGPKHRRRTNEHAWEYTSRNAVEPLSRYSPSIIIDVVEKKEAAQGGGGKQCTILQINTEMHTHTCIKHKPNHRLINHSVAVAVAAMPFTYGSSDCSNAERSHMYCCTTHMTHRDAVHKPTQS